LGDPVAFFAPTYKMLGDVWREVVRVLAPVTLRVNVQDKRIELITGGVIDFWSLTKFDSIRGRKYKRVVIDEVAMVPGFGDAWQFVIRPTLTDFKGDAFFLSTPKGHNFFHQAYVWGQDPYKKEWTSFSMPTTANPFIDPEEVEAAREDMPERTYAQEYLAQFLEDAGGVFRGVRKVATAKVLPPYYGSFVMGVDWAQMHDFTVLTVMDALSKKVVDFDRFNQIGWELQRGRLMSMALRWRPWLILAESNSIGGPNIEALQREGLPVAGFEMGAHNKGPLITNLVLGIEREELELLNDEVSIGELEAYESKANPVTGRRKYSAPQGMHDDTVISQCLAWRGITNAAEYLPQMPAQPVTDPVEISSY